MSGCPILRAFCEGWGFLVFCSAALSAAPLPCVGAGFTPRPGRDERLAFACRRIAQPPAWLRPLALTKETPRCLSSGRPASIVDSIPAIPFKRLIQHPLRN